MDLEQRGDLVDDPVSAISQTIVDRLRRHAWSRAGAVAAVLASGPPRRVIALSTRVFMLFAGSLLISVSVAVTLWTRLGPGPLDVFIGAIHDITGLPLSIAVWVTVGTLIAIAWLLGRRPGLGTLLSPLLIGPMLQATTGMLGAVAAPESLVIRVALQMGAIAGIGVGAGALIVSGLGAGSGELFAGAASDRVGRPESRVRPVIELSWIVIGVALGGPAGFGTILVAAFIGPAVSGGYRLVDGLFARSRRGVASTHELIVARDYALSR